MFHRLTVRSFAFACGPWLLLLGAVGACRPMAPAARAPAGRASAVTEVDGSELLSLIEARAPQAVLVDVWATWCRPCVRELPAMIEFDRELEEVDVVFVSADLHAARPEACRKLADLGVPAPYLFQGGSVQAFIEALSPDWSGALPARFLFRGAKRLGFWEGILDYATLRAALAGHVELDSDRGE